MFASSTSWFSRINPFVPNALFLYPLKTPENRKGVENWCIGNEWVKRVWVSRSNDNVPREWTSLGELYSRALQIIYRTNDVKRFFGGVFPLAGNKVSLQGLPRFSVLSSIFCFCFAFLSCFCFCSCRRCCLFLFCFCFFIKNCWYYVSGKCITWH